MQQLTPGTKLTDMLTLVNVLGEGGMGTVWLANHRTLGTEVAVKVMHPELAHRDPSLLERFQSEAQAAAKIRHPHIVQMLDHGKTEDGTVWLAMELLEGESLGALLRGTGAVSAPFAVTVIKQVAGAVGKAHAAGIIHRDLKPENLQVLTVGGEPFVKVLDFGIAKVTTQSSGMTATSAVFGTPAYMSPEQLLSTKKVDAGADLWALAVVAYELLTGQLPFQGETSTAIAIAVAAGHFAPASSLKPHLGIALDAWFSRAFERNAAARFPSAEELGATFAQAAGAHATGGQAAPLHPELQGSAQRAVSGALPQTKFAAPAFLAERGGTEVASSPRIPEAPAATFAKREKGSSASVRNGLVIGGVALLGVLGALVYSKGEKPSSADAKTDADTKIPTNAKAAADTDSKCKPGSGMNSIPAGTFTMGSLSGEDDEKPPHEVTVAAFCLDVTEVTMSAYKACVDAEACKPAHEDAFVPGLDAATLAVLSKACNQKQAGREAHPVNCVDWDQATAYCAAQKKRLPTEEEWEYAARGGSEQRLYPWGIAAPDATLLNACGSECEGTKKMYPTADGYATTAPVGMFPKGDGRWGHHDLAGNVWEWTSSGYSKDYTVERGTAARVLRGGGWFDDNPSNVRSASRIGDEPTIRYGFLGLRCAGSLLP